MVLHLLALHVFVLLVVFAFLDRVHTIVLVGFAFKVGFFFGGQKLPGCTHETCDGTALGWHAAFGLLQAKDVCRKEHVVAGLVAFAIRLLVGGLVLRHLFFVALAIRFRPEKRSGRKDCENGLLV